MAKSGASAKEAVMRARKIQAGVDARDQARSRKKTAKKPMQAGHDKYPDEFPAQHIRKPGLEAELKQPPLFAAKAYRGSEKLKDMVAIVTGGDSGIGRAIAVLYAREGADVAIVYLSEHEDAKATKAAVEAEGRRCLVISGDVRSASFCERAVKQTLREFGRIDILVNNAAFQEHEHRIEDLTDEHFGLTLKTNLYGYFYGARRRAPYENRLLDRDDGIGHRHHGQQGSARLFDDQGWDPRLYPIAGRSSDRSWHPRECGGAGPGMDAAQPGRQGGPGC